ncbi:tetratricopeptide repeat protein [candidate division CSSED10-310 bacterium]|uniref:Tetratricopeptide repeat protein n=1 Tax=candidate division CSSED10-310 bacterium TaxID=2855610 RepID=A0ABV6Z0D1_UNCC1
MKNLRYSLLTIIIIQFLLASLLISCGDKSKKLVFEADQLRMMNKYDEAEKLYKKSIEIDSNNGLAYNNYGVLLQIQKKYDDALKNFQKALELFPETKEKVIATNNIGLNFDLQGEYDTAIKYYLQALELNPSYYEGCHNLGSVYLAQNDLDNAIKTLSKAIKLIETGDIVNKAAAIQNSSQFLALAYFRKGELEITEKIIAGLIHLNPFNEMNYAVLGDVYIKKQAYKEATDQFLKGLSCNPNSLNSRAGLGLALAYMGELDKAIEEINIALTLNKDTVIARKNAGLVYKMKGDLERAQKEWEAGLKIDPKDQALQQLLAELKAK